MYICFHVKWPFFFQILIKLEFSQIIFEKYLDIFYKIRPVKNELFHAGRQTEIQIGQHQQSLFAIALTKLKTRQIRTYFIANLSPHVYLYLLPPPIQATTVEGVVQLDH
jgi:hypothetical protein